MGTLIYIVLLMSLANFAQANDGIKNGMPCLGEICIGDDIESLGKIKWDPSKTMLIEPLAKLPS